MCCPCRRPQGAEAWHQGVQQVLCQHAANAAGHPARQVPTGWSVFGWCAACGGFGLLQLWICSALQLPRSLHAPIALTLWVVDKVGLTVCCSCCCHCCPRPSCCVQTGHPAFMYVVSELLKVFASEPAADTNMGHILVALLRGGCQKLTTLQVGIAGWQSQCTAMQRRLSSVAISAECNRLVGAPTAPTVVTGSRTARQGLSVCKPQRWTYCCPHHQTFVFVQLCRTWTMLLT